MDKVLVVTGASAGIGAAVATLAARAGYAVCVNHRDSAAKAEALVETLRASGARAIAVQADVRTEEGVRCLFDETDAQLGRLTHLVNNAGIISRIRPFEDITLDELHAVFATNVYGSFLCAREAVRRMDPQAGGCGGAIVNLSSAAARLGSPHEFIDYAASKGAIDTLTIGLSKEVAARGIRVNAVRPGLIQTDMHAHAGDADRPARLKNTIPQQRAGTTDEVAQAVMWLLSDAAGYVTGALLDVSGGR